MDNNILKRKKRRPSAEEIRAGPSKGIKIRVRDNLMEKTKGSEISLKELKTEQLKEEILALKWLAEKKEKELAKVLTLLKVKERILAELPTVGVTPGVKDPAEPAAVPTVTASSTATLIRPPPPHVNGSGAVRFPITQPQIIRSSGPVILPRQSLLKGNQSLRLINTSTGQVLTPAAVLPAGQGAVNGIRAGTPLIVLKPGTKITPALQNLIRPTTPATSITANIASDQSNIQITSFQSLAAINGLSKSPRKTVVEDVEPEVMVVKPKVEKPSSPQSILS